MRNKPEKSEGIDKFLAMAGVLAQVQGVSRKEVLDDLSRRVKDVAVKKGAPPGKFRVLGVDKFDETDWIEGDYTTRKKALAVARKMTDEAKKSVFSSEKGALAGYDLATVYYAYDDQGRYLGGDTWKGE